MNAKLVIGQRIVAVKQRREKLNAGSVWTLDWVKLENGVLLIPLVHEGEVENAVSLIVNETGHKPRTKGAKKHGTKETG